MMIQDKVATYILHFEDEEKAKSAYDILDEIKTLLTFERSQDLWLLNIQYFKSNLSNKNRKLNNVF